MALTRRRLLGRAGTAGALGLLQAAGIYGLLDGLATMPKRVDASGLSLPPEQHLINGIQVITDNNIQVIVPPLHHQVVTAKLTVAPGKSNLQAAQKRLEAALQVLDSKYPDTPGGLNVTVGWGLPYFNTYVAGPWSDHAPVDNRATATNGSKTLALIEAVRFASDPASTILEQNDIAVAFASDSLHNIDDGSFTIFNSNSDVLQVTSIRKGFVGGGFGNNVSLPKQMALQARIPGAQFIPESAELFLGFTSTQKASLGPGQIANLESLILPGLGDLTDQWPNGYFRNGTTMHLSHLFEDLEAWYTQNNFASRVQHVFKPEVSVPEGTLTVSEGPADVETENQVLQDAQPKPSGYGLVGHSGSLQPASRLSVSLTDHYGTTYPAGTAIPQRADFDTLDNPFFSPGNGSYAAGLHFVVFAPTSDAFHRTRKAMDGVYADGRTISQFGPRSASMGVNSVLTTTHRQNFLVPGRNHRSFPLAELL